jgi:hypothetical protein
MVVNLATSTVTYQNVATGTLSSYRADKTAWAVVEPEDGITPSYTIAFGGRDSSDNPLTTLARFSFSAQQWQTITATGTAPTSRVWATGVYLPRCDPTNPNNVYLGCFIVYGGVTGQHATGALRADADILFLNTTGTPYWSSPASFTSNAPTARHSAGAVAGLDGRTVYMFGGDTSVGVVNDFYMISPSGYSDLRLKELFVLSQGANVSASSIDSRLSGPLSTVTDGSLIQDHNQVSLGSTATTSNNRCYHSTCGPTGNCAYTGGVIPTGTTNPWIRIDLGTSMRSLFGAELTAALE